MPKVHQSYLFELLEREVDFILSKSSIEYFMLDLERFLNIIYDNFENIIKQWGYNHHIFYEEREKESISFNQELIEMKLVVEKYILDNKIEITVPDEFSFTRFEEILNDSSPSGFSLAPDIAMDESKGGKLERILSIYVQKIKSKYIESESPKEFQALKDNFTELCQRRRYWILEIGNFARLDPYETIKFLINVVENINPKPKTKQELRNNFFTLIQDNRKFGWAHTLAYAPISRYADFNPMNTTPAQMEKQVDILKEQITRLSFGIQRELSLSYFISEIVYRFKHRAESYDFKRLLHMANEIEEGRTTRNAEEKLTVEMCKFLFDNGLTPFYRFNVGELEIDVLETGDRKINPLLIEAKVTHRSDRNNLLDGVKQLFSYLRRVSEKNKLYSAWYVIFRTGGPQYVLPEQIQIGRYVLFPIIINIAPPEEDGSRTGDIVEITIDEVKEYISEEQDV